MQLQLQVHSNHFRYRLSQAEATGNWKETTVNLHRPLTPSSLAS